MGPADVVLRTLLCGLHDATGKRDGERDGRDAMEIWRRPIHFPQLWTVEKGDTGELAVTADVGRSAFGSQGGAFPRGSAETIVCGHEARLNE